jgi:hypothetical protein
VPDLIAQLGIRLQLLIGQSDAPPRPAPFEIVDALAGFSVTNRDRERDGFQLEFSIGRDSALDYGLLRGGILDAPNRVIITMLFGGRPQELIDGVITDLQVNPSNEPGRSTLHVTGEDRSARLSFEDRNATHPNQSDSTIVRQILTDAGFQPQVTDTPDTPDDRERVPTQQCSNLQYVHRLAQRNGFVFYVEPTEVPGVNRAYWGPEQHDGPRQPALTLNMGPFTNVDTPINFHYNALGPTEPDVSIIDLDSRSGMSVSPPASLSASLARSPARPLRRSIARNVANLSYAQAERRAGAGVADSANALQATGEVDAARYGCVLRARRLVEVCGAGNSYDGTYYVKEVVHAVRRFPRAEYKMRFTLLREGRGAAR